MTTSRETAGLDHAALRDLVDRASKLTLADRLTLVKGLIPGIAEQLSGRDLEGFVAELRLKGERYHEAKAHPVEGRAVRRVPGEREFEGR